MRSDLIRGRGAVAPLVLALSLLAGPAVAQSAPSTSDLAALRYYVQQGDQSSVQAELQRLRQIYPDWTPPADLSRIEAEATPTAEIDQIYRLIASGQLDEAQALITATQARFADWVPPADMRSLLATARAQQQFDSIVDSDPARAAQLARTTPALTRCDRINNVWRLAEAQQKSGQGAQALGAYRSIVATCPAFPDVYATLQKADPVAPLDQLDAMFAEAASRFPGQEAALADLEQQLRAGRGEATVTTAAPATAPAARPGASRQAAAADPAPRRAAPSAQSSGQSSGQSAGQSSARAPAPAPGNAGGAIPMPATAWGRLPVSGDPRLGQMRAAASAGAWQRCLALTPQPRSLDLLNERGWCSLNLDRPMEALSSFAAVAQGRVPAAMARDARYGMALSYLDMEMTNEAAKIAAATNFTLEQRRAVEGQILTQRAVASYDRQDYLRTIGYLDALDEMQGGLNRGLGVLRAYAYLNAGKRAQAFRLFEQMHNQMAGDDTRAGMRASRGGG
ncbi:hypothetical protein [Frigidibacter oleivorans]|uniref:hypothetical protein n=1 Tax=Frigidibacter oleivorans TaxID=2487129 RepID=UPI000F8F00B0|nr:hypothetical protein [Frigidibacter oleivorans]